MRKHGPEPENKSTPADGARAQKTGQGAAEALVEAERLLEHLERWEERYFQDNDDRPESLGIDDPALLEALRQRIKEQKHLYKFLGLSGQPPAEPGDGGGGALQRNPHRTRGSADREQEGAGPSPVELHDHPRSIGRYQVRRTLGRGGYGHVYLAHDSDLDRFVAIKVPIPERISAFASVEDYLSEARTLARLSHPNIVPVYDVGRTDDGLCYVVSRYMDGGDLAARLRESRYTFDQAAKIVVVLAEALHYAHTQDLFHRDIKPANILLDATGEPSLADFGLALDEENHGTGAGLVGTTAYMSPEQARGEGHLVDGRSDIFSLAIVFYELLAGRRPYRGVSREEVMRKIVNHEPRPPRQIDDSIPRELERICMKGLARRASERYSTALDFGDDLRHFLQTGQARGATGGGRLGSQPAGATLSPSNTPAELRSPVYSPYDSNRAVARIIPKGLCSFDEHDADFFLELLPGPRDRHGVPDGLRFWKTRIDASDPDKSFRVGIVYGPSGCGKSSLIKAGLLPLLTDRIAPVYVETTGGETEARLLRNLKKAFPRLSSDASLVEAMCAVRLGECLPPGSKALLILDQFEQWLFTRPKERDTELVLALRQCDGEHLQALCLVRDDFWMATTRFMSDLEVDLVPNRNVAAVDLFTPKHARKVLAAYGRAYDAIPADGTGIAKEHEAFLERAVEGLAQECMVVPVRLALFAEMIKGKPWTSATLREMGGIGGVGVQFLEETFSSARALPRHHLHEKAAQGILKALLPETNADIKGRMRSIAELRTASGYADRPKAFEDLIRMLDGELRLITPVDLAVSSDDEPPNAPGTLRSYQLSHDYLVHSLRDWLTSKQRETRKGRAALLLEERSAVWNSRPEKRHLPSAREWLGIRLLTRPRDWNAEQTQMMKRATSLHGARLAGGLILAATLAGAVVASNVTSRTNLLLSSLPRSDVAKIPEVLNHLVQYPRWTYGRRLRELAAQATDDPRARLGYSLALLPGDRAQVDYLHERLSSAGPAEMAVIRDALQPFRLELTGMLWTDLRGAKAKGGQILPVAGVLAKYDPTSANWRELAPKVADAMALASLADWEHWSEKLMDVRESITGPMIDIYRDKSRPDVEHVIATEILARYASDKPGRLVDVLIDAEPKSFSILFPVVERNAPAIVNDLRAAVSAPFSIPAPVEPNGNVGLTGIERTLLRRWEKEKGEYSARRARAAVAMVRLGYASEVWHLLEHSSVADDRSAFIAAANALGVEIPVIVAELERLGRNSAKQLESGENNAYLFDQTTSKRRALILILAGFRLDSLPASEREALAAAVVDMYQNDVDAGVHSAAELLLRRWGYEDRLKLVRDQPRFGAPGPVRRWYVNRAGQTMVLVSGPSEFEMGSRNTDPNRQLDEPRHRAQVPRKFAIATTEVTVDQFQAYAKERLDQHHKSILKRVADTRVPQTTVTWFDAAAYCNWLSEREHLPKCYEPNEKGEYVAFQKDENGKEVPGVRVNADAVAKGGYRLPTEVEWEYTCRAGAKTSRYFGDVPGPLKFYEWFIDTSEHNIQVCGRLLPNDLGLFDTLGNVAEWCHDRYFEPKTSDGDVQRDLISDEKVTLDNRHFRGERYHSPHQSLRCAIRMWLTPSELRADLGFRPARSIP